MYTLSRIYRIDDNAVRVYVTTEYPPDGYDDLHATVLIADMRQDVYRVDRRDGVWVVTATRTHGIT